MHDASPASPEAPDLCSMGHRDAKNEVPDKEGAGGGGERRSHRKTRTPHAPAWKTPFQSSPWGGAQEHPNTLVLETPSPVLSRSLLLSPTSVWWSLCAWGDACSIGLFTPKTQPRSLGFHAVSPQRPWATLLGPLVGMWGCSGSICQSHWTFVVQGRNGYKGLYDPSSEWAAIGGLPPVSQLLCLSP